MRSFDAAPVEVRLEACYCPGSPHEADLVYLAPFLPMAGGMAAQSAMNEGLAGNQVRLQELLADIWIRHGVVGWNLVDETGDPVALTPTNIVAALPYGKGGRLVADRADDLYAEDILDPLRKRLESISPRGRTNGSSSSRKASTRKQPSPSSTATTEPVPPSA